MKNIFQISGTAALTVLFMSLMACGSTPPPGAAKKPVLLVVSFGTSFNDSREKTIGAIEKALAAAYPGYEQRRAFTSQIIIDKLAREEGLKIDNVEQAIKRLVKDGVKEVLVQPTHVMNGEEYDSVIEEFKPFEKRFTRIRYGEPLLITDADYDEVIDALIAETRQYADDHTAVVFMGHGTHHEANAAYAKLDRMIKARGIARYYIGTVEASPSLDDVVAALRGTGGITKVVLSPLMIVAGDHANNDMAGDEEDSWKSILTAQGYQAVPVLKGLGEYPAIQRIFVRHAGEALK
ncbi:MAG: sirohydrochlorin cobaltochelatase [Spirochaetaceae bacterium]|nr:sirohydrochlorin cobaltochelatase [Spirochaetaceae bacterium]